MIDFFEFQLRPRVLYKAGLVDDIGPEIANLGAQHALIVADEGVARAGLLDRVRAGLERSIHVAGIFTEHQTREPQFRSGPRTPVGAPENRPADPTAR